MTAPAPPSTPGISAADVVQRVCTTAAARLRWVAAGLLNQLADNTAVPADLAGVPDCLARSGEKVHALYDECSLGQVALSDGEVEDDTLECWLHGSRFDLSTGMPTGPTATRPVPVYAVHIIAGVIEVALPPGHAATGRG